MLRISNPEFYFTFIYRLHSAQEEHQKLLKVKDDEQKAAIAAASVAAAKKRSSETNSSTTQPVKKARPEGREAARAFHQSQQNFQQNQGFGYNQGQWGNYQPVSAL